MNVIESRKAAKTFDDNIIRIISFHKDVPEYWDVFEMIYYNPKLKPAKNLNSYFG